MFCVHIIFYLTVLWSMSVLCQDSFDPYADPAAGGTGNNNRDRNQYGNSNNNDPYNRDRNQSQYDRDRYGNNNDRDRDRDRYGSNNNDRDRDRYGNNDNRDYNNRDRNQYGNDQYGRSNQSGGQYGTGGATGGYNSQDNRDRNQYGSQDYNNRDRNQNDRDRNQYDRNDDRNYGGGNKFMDDGNCCEEYCYGIDEDPYLRFGDKTAYQFVYGKGSNQHIVPQCKPIQFWAMIRDGAKFPDRMTIQRLRQMNRIHDDIVRNYEDKRSYPDKGKLCQEDYEPLKRWRWNDTISDHNENGLTAQGTEDLKFIARRYQTRLRDLLSTSYSEGQYYFQYTSDGERTVDSYKAFLEGLLANDAFRVHANVKNAVDRNNPYSQCDNNQYNSQSGSSQDRYNSQSNSPYGGSNSNNYGSNYGSPSSSSSPYGSDSNTNSQYGSNSNSQYGSNSNSNSQYGSNANNYNSGGSGSNYNDNNVYNSNSNTGNTGNTNYNSNSGGYGGGGGGVGGGAGFGDNSQGFVEYRKFTEKQEYREMVKNVFRRLGFRYSLNESVILDMYDLCRYEKAWNVNRPSPWCAVFTKDQLKLLEYGEDLKSYYNDGYGNFQNKKKGCLPLKDLHDRFERTVNNGYASEQKAAFQFTDAATLKLLLVSMGIAEDHSTLTADNYYQQRTRTWRTAELTPYGGNLAAILYQCEQGEKFRVMLFLNEKPVEYPGCSVGLCNWNTFKNKIDRSVRECDFCGNGSSSLSTRTFLTITLVAIVLSIFSRV